MPYSEKLVDERWVDSKGIVDGIEKINTEPFAMLISTQEMLFKLVDWKIVHSLRRKTKKTNYGKNVQSKVDSWMK